MGIADLKLKMSKDGEPYFDVETTHKLARNIEILLLHMHMSSSPFVSDESKDISLSELIAMSLRNTAMYQSEAILKKIECPNYETSMEVVALRKAKELKESKEDKEDGNTAKGITIPPRHKLN